MLAKSPALSPGQQDLTNPVCPPCAWRRTEFPVDWWGAAGLVQLPCCSRASPPPRDSLSL